MPATVTPAGARGRAIENGQFYGMTIAMAPVDSLSSGTKDSGGSHIEIRAAGDPQTVDENTFGGTETAPAEAVTQKGRAGRGHRVRARQARAGERDSQGRADGVHPPADRGPIDAGGRPRRRSGGGNRARCGAPPAPFPKVRTGPAWVAACARPCSYKFSLAGDLGDGWPRRGQSAPCCLRPKEARSRSACGRPCRNGRPNGSRLPTFVGATRAAPISNLARAIRSRTSDSATEHDLSHAVTGGASITLI